jgi:HlyD family secretion protein
MKIADKMLMIIIIAIAIIAGFFAVNWKKDSPDTFLSGMVETRHIDVASKIAGRIDSLLVHEGDSVAKGTVLAVLESKELSAKVEQARGAMDAAGAKNDLAKNGARPQELEAAEKAYLQAKAQCELFEKTFKRVSNLHQDSVISSQEYDQVQAQYISARELMDAAKAKFEMVKEGARSEDKIAAKSIYYQASNAYQEASAYLEELSLKSPLNGEVEKVVSDPGEVIGAGYPVVTIIDPTDLWVILQVKENSMSTFKKGAIFKGTVPALGNIVVSFKVTYISPMADFATWRPTNQKGEFDIRTFEIHLRPVDAVNGLRAGMTVNISL